MARLMSPSVPLFLLLSVFLMVATGHVQDNSADPSHPQDTPTWPHHSLSDASADAMGTIHQGSIPPIHSAEDYPTECRSEYWQVCFHTVSDCVAGPMSIGRRDCFDEKTNPSGREPKEGYKYGSGPCNTFENYASATIDTESCLVNIYQDDSCQVLLDGWESAYYPDSHICLRRLTTDPALKNDPRPAQFFRFSGSWNVSCPPLLEDCPEKLECEEECVSSHKSFTWPPTD